MSTLLWRGDFYVITSRPWKSVLAAISMGIVADLFERVSFTTVKLSDVAAEENRVA